ncbi:MAG: hypothetical protein BWY57_00214 [Betaproteobacteria bacterium ADurb.Bin341]|nr:MAG: hypothetical protein BWY57_00214 [Betaproteobacteria bacterium ADurb.Bin341]
MEVTQLSSLASALAAARTGDAVSILVMKKALEMEGQSALQLVAAATQGSVNPDHLGQSVDVKA